MEETRRKLEKFSLKLIMPRPDVSEGLLCCCVHAAACLAEYLYSENQVVSDTGFLHSKNSNTNSTVFPLLCIFRCRIIPILGVVAFLMQQFPNYHFMLGLKVFPGRT